MAESNARTTSTLAERLRLSPEQVTVQIDVSQLGFSTTREVSPLTGTIGQDRAMRALAFGLGTRTAGYNVFVSGVPGSGRNTTLASYLQQISSHQPVPSDWIYVYNFNEPLRPIALRLPAGKGREFSADMDQLVAECRQRMTAAFEGPEYQQRVEEGIRDAREQHRRTTQELADEARRRGVGLNFTPMGVAATMLKPDGEAMSADEFEALPAEERERRQASYRELEAIVQARLNELQQLERQANRRRHEVDEEVARAAARPLFEELTAKYAELPTLIDHLNRAQQDVVSNHTVFHGGDQQPPLQPGAPPGGAGQDGDDALVRYRVNVFVSHHGTVGAPVVFEDSPTYYNVFGRIEHKLRMGALSTDFTQIRAGTFHRASGGFLVMQAKDVLGAPFVWQSVKQTLRSGQARIENLGEQYGAIPVSTLNPEPIPIDVKLVLVGNPMLFRLLLLYDEDFRKFFRVKADFDTVMPRNLENSRMYAGFVASRVQQEGLLDFDAEAAAKVIEYSCRLAGDQERLTTRFSDIAGLVTEANYWAAQAGHTVVSGDDVRQAIAEHTYRSNLIEERLQDLYEEGTIHVEVDGSVVGQVNGLAVIDVGDYMFGRPSRLTARVSLGRTEFSNADQESGMAGPIHSKGFQILLGYLTGEYGLDVSLPIRASVAFEQNYSGVEGDSASSTELYALLSSLSGLPIDQSIGVTGSVDQHGDVQAVGGVTEKVEGFYEVCKALGLTGRQGVIIPRSNVRNLVLRDEVVEAIKAGRFHIYGVGTIREGFELLTGMPGGSRRPDGTFASGTFDEAIRASVQQMWERIRAMQGQDGTRQQLPSPAPALQPADDSDRRERDKREGNGEPPKPPPP